MCPFFFVNTTHAQTARGISMFKTKQTATYSAVLSQAGDFSAAVGDMEIHQEITPSYVSTVGSSYFELA